MIERPSEKEEEYFRLEELKRLKAMREQAATDMAVQERERLKALHWMRCPKCGMEMTEIHFKGIQVDVCGTCSGVFFDAGEVEQLLGHGRGFLTRVAAGLLGRDAT